jgi:RNA polymerase sigma-70 factor (ECF subfamily)
MAFRSYGEHLSLPELHHPFSDSFVFQSTNSLDPGGGNQSVKKESSIINHRSRAHRDRMPPMDEIALIREAQRGDLDAFNTLVLHYQDTIFNTAFRILGDEELAADATQEAFLSAFRGLKTFRGGSFKAWLMRTVTNAAYDELRGCKRRPAVPLEADGEKPNDTEESRWLADPSLTPEETLEARELEHAMEHCLEGLPLDYRTVVVMADIEGLDYTEVATAVQVPLGTVKSRLARARLRLRECLQGFEELLPAMFRLQHKPSS